LLALSKSKEGKIEEKSTKGRTERIKEEKKGL